jgi:hypothetical protein
VLAPQEISQARTCVSRLAKTVSSALQHHHNDESVQDTKREEQGSNKKSSYPEATREQSPDVKKSAKGERHGKCSAVVDGHRSGADKAI